MKQAEDASAVDARLDEELLPEAEPMAIQDIRDALVIRERDLFLLTDMAGQVPRGNTNGYGLYYEDTRYLSGYEFSFSLAKPMVLLSTAELGYSSEHVLTNPTLTDLEGRRVPSGTIEVRRLRVLEDVLEETLLVTNYNSHPVVLDLVFRFAADFADIFEVRGYEPEFRGELDPPLWRHAALAMGYKGKDGRRKETLIMFTPRPLSVQTDAEVGFATFHAQLASQGSISIRLVVTVDGRLEAAQGVERYGVVTREYDTWLAGATEIRTDNEFYNLVLQRSLSDLRMLWNHHVTGAGYPAAGTPWYDTLFGRDSAIVGLQTLALKPDIARDCLVSLARWQGTKFDSWRDEEPGKILHELRQGELTETGELPFSPYYGSVDSTPLFLWLAGEYFAWTGDLGLLGQLETNLRAGLHWLGKYGGLSDGGYIRYQRRSSRGLVNQGWKDSRDAICHVDGRLGVPPIALVEVQGYAYAAQRSLARVFAALGDGRLAARLEDQAAALGRRFSRDFWLGDFYALARDGSGQACASIASNGGHALWTGIAGGGHAARTARRLMERDMFSGWGVRTLSATSVRHNPLGYHMGTVWPHDNSIITMGFKRYGFEDQVNALAGALFDAARAFPYYRLPELFGGDERSVHQSPVPYPVACRPQAWAAGAIPLVTQAILGLCPDALNGVLYIVRPRLPKWLEVVHVNRLKIGGAEVDLLYKRRGDVTQAEVLNIRGDVRVEKRRSWPEPAPLAAESVDAPRA
ncbi:MAG: amylo-alpha-1,6-glucosidase [Chloroflexi bacterium]|nr:MAG: amylo-alpha-1,6-glucosidase [Chloroflexota bacterium]